MKKEENPLFDVEKIVEYLLPYTSNLSKSYFWNTPKDAQIIALKENGIIDLDQSNELLLIKNMFIRNVKLKQMLASTITATHSIESKKSIYKWIVEEWGGITVRNIDKLYSSVEDFISRSAVNGKSKRIDNIASVSKVLSFMYPERYIIYDARVAYSINWILLKSNAAKIFFPMPESRNSKINAIDIASLIRLSRINNYSKNLGSDNMISNSDKKVFIDKSESYPILCDLIAKINNCLWCDERQNYPFYAEMLIFSMADTIIFTDILNSCSLDIG